MLIDPETGQPMRCGRTKDFERRRAEHRRNPETRGMDFDPVHRTDNYATQRGLEQLMHDQLKPPLDRINPIGPTNPKRGGYLKAAEDYMNGGLP